VPSDAVPVCLSACRTLQAGSLLVVPRQARLVCEGQPPASGRPGERAAGPGRGAGTGRPLRGRAPAGGGGAVAHSGRAARRSGVRQPALAACCDQSWIPRDSTQHLALSHQHCAHSELRDLSRAGTGSWTPAPGHMRQALQVVRGAVLLLTAASDAKPATLGAARAALGAALAPAEAPSDAHAIAHALLSQAEALRRKPDRAVAHVQQARARPVPFPAKPSAQADRQSGGSLLRACRPCGCWSRPCRTACMRRRPRWACRAWPGGRCMPAPGGRSSGLRCSLHDAGRLGRSQHGTRPAVSTNDPLH